MARNDLNGMQRAVGDAPRLDTNGSVAVNGSGAGSTGASDAAPTQSEPGRRGEPWAAEIAALREQIALFRGGRLAPEKFKEYRLANGIYGQRQDGVHMIRVKIANGVLHPDQLDALAEIAERFGHGIAHLTTRQDVQYHYIRLEEMPEVLEILARVGLHSREACGNSIRNVTSCPFSGVCADEPFPVLPYAQALSRFFLRHAAGQMLSRKFKVAFSGCASDCAAGAIHDIGAIARVQNGRRGFRLLVGGGLGAVPMAASVLSDFLPAEDLLRAGEAIVRVFSDHGNRRNRARARLKFVVHGWGIERFREAFQQKMAELSSEPRPDLDLSSYLYESELAQLDSTNRNGGSLPAPSAASDVFLTEGTLTGGIASDGLSPDGLSLEGRSPEALSSDRLSREERLPEGRSPEVLSNDFYHDERSVHPAPEDLGTYAHWLSSSTRPERNRETRSVTVSFPLGDVPPAALRSLAEILREVGANEVRITIQQNLVLQGAPISRLPLLFSRLQSAGIAASRAGTALDVLSCPGSDTCNLGITTSKGLAEAISDELHRSTLPADVLEGVSIKISGCPNGCGQHHIGNLGFHGVARKAHGRQVPHYQLHIGGGIDERGAFLGRGGIKIPARNVPQAAHRLLSAYAERRANGEDFAGFLRGLEPEAIESELSDLLEVPDPTSGPEFFQDYHQDTPFTTETLGVGECAGAGSDASVDRFADPLASLDAAERFLALGLPADVLGEVRRAAHSTARVVLDDGLGCRTVSDFETRCEFQARLVDRGHASEAWEQLVQAIDRAAKRSATPQDSLPDLVDRGRAFLDEGRRLLEALQEIKPGASLPGLRAHGGEMMD